MYGKIENDSITYFVQPDWLLGDSSNYAKSQGYKEIIFNEGDDDSMSENDTTIIVTKKRTIIVPKEISMMKCCLMLQSLGLLTQVEALINADTTGNSQLIWKTASSCVRNSNMIKQIAYALNYTDAMMDDFFINANKINV